MFRRKKRQRSQRTDDELLELDEPLGSEEQDDVYAQVAIALARCPNPFGGVAVVIGHLLASDAVTAEQLATLGMTDEDLEALTQAFEANSNIDDLVEDLAIGAARRIYDSDIGLICSELGLNEQSPARREFRSNLAGFALENGIEDIRLAYRLLRLERPDLLP